jgi:methylthioribose-1-phosphate isomerase
LAEYQTISWEAGRLRMLDQRLLPAETVYQYYTRPEEIAGAIRDMVIRGAPAIGAAAAFGLALAAERSPAQDRDGLITDLEQAARLLRAARPTAVNLSWALDRVMNKVKSVPADEPDQIRVAVLEEAQAIAAEDVAVNRQIGLNGVPLVPDGARIIHHCNTGSLATVDYGTALGVIRAAYENGKNLHVFVDETRPRLQGARLTSWELKRLNIPHSVVVDGSSGYLMSRVGVDLCIVGADRVASNGDTANKIGTYNLALVAYAHGVPFYVACPTSTIDLSIKSGDEIEIEQRPADEVTFLGEVQLTPDGVSASNPAFDITPARYITAIITERGIAYPPYEESLASLL